LQIRALQQKSPGAGGKGQARTEELVSSKFGTRLYVNAAAAPLLQLFENYYGASH
jgi:hypothetical protein